jgi:hypothetical protein
MHVYTEGLTRTNVGANPVWMTFTPLAHFGPTTLCAEAIQLVHPGYCRASENPTLKSPLSREWKKDYANNKSA